MMNSLCRHLFTGTAFPLDHHCRFRAPEQRDGFTHLFHHRRGAENIIQRMADIQRARHRQRHVLRLVADACQFYCIGECPADGIIGINENAGHAALCGDIGNQARAHHHRNAVRFQGKTGRPCIFGGHITALFNLHAETLRQRIQSRKSIAVINEADALTELPCPRQSLHDVEPARRGDNHRHRQMLFQIRAVRARTDNRITAFCFEPFTNRLHCGIEPQINRTDTGTGTEFRADVTEQGKKA